MPAVASGEAAPVRMFLMRMGLGRAAGSEEARILGDRCPPQAKAVNV